MTLKPLAIACLAFTMTACSMAPTSSKQEQKPADQVVLLNLNLLRHFML